MTTSEKIASLWLVGSLAIGIHCCVQIGCDPGRVPLDAGIDAAQPEDLGQVLPDFAAVPACVACSWSEPSPGCTPSRCARRPDGQMCCVQALDYRPLVAAASGGPVR